MNKYPFVYVLRDTDYASEVDWFFEENKEKLDCSIEIISINEINKLNNMFDSNHHILVTYGNEKLYINKVMSIIVDRMRNRWINIKTFTTIEEFNSNWHELLAHSNSSNLS